ncbi:MAG: tRNA pseudouridine synthase A [bacterium]|nr:MAG: tRNA pseudouridine synthase A [bacterium]
MRNIKTLIQYDGNAYHGWQSQADTVTVQGMLEATLSGILQEPVSVIGSGRTDRGVHALGQVANFHTQKSLGCQQIMLALNSCLPKDIRILQCEDVDQDFHSRFSARKREYKYVIYNDIVCSPFVRNYVHFIRKTIDIHKLKESLEVLVGEYDFRSLCSVGDESTSKIRTIYDIEVERVEKEIIVWIRANAFLRRMVRMIMGLVIEINLKGLAIEEVGRVLQLKCRESHNYPSASPQGLFLSRVWY